MKKRVVPVDRKTSRRPKKRSRLWRWLGVGALGVAAAAALSRRKPTPTRLPVDPVEEPEPRFELDEDMQAGWLSGVSGSLRFVERHPEGDLCIVFVHGLGGRAEHWAPLMANVGPAIRVVAFDLPGHAESDPSADDDYSIAALAGSIGALLNGLGLRRPVLVGHSLGAAAAIEYAGRHPGRVGGLFLVDPNADQTRQPSERLEELIEQVRRDPADEIAWMYRQLLGEARSVVADEVLTSLSSVAPEILAALFESAAKYSPLPALERFAGPVHAAASAYNTLPTSLPSLVPSLRTSHLDDASHWLMMDQPSEVWALLVELLEEAVAIDARP